MLDKNDQVIARLGKLDNPSEMGLEPYPHHFKRSHDSESLKANKESLLKSEEKISLQVVWFVLIAKARCALCTLKTVSGVYKSFVRRIF